MVYTPKFISNNQKVVDQSFGKIPLAGITDTVLETAENRVIFELETGGLANGYTLNYQTLLGYGALYVSLLEIAAIYAVIAEYNSGGGKANVVAGPITSVSGDGMQKGHGFYTSKRISTNDQLTAEQKFHTYMNRLFTLYNMKNRSNRNRHSRYNEMYDPSNNVNFYDHRKSEGSLFE